MAEIAVQVQNLRKQYGRRVAVADVSFDIRAGETFALLGPNGAGKSTTVEILEGYRRRNSGDVRVLGHDPARADAAFRARIGVVLQSAGELGALSVREQLTQFAGFYPHPRDVDEVIAAVGLTEHAGRRVSKLSGGQQRRVDVALGIIGRPEVLFLDEPTTGFDPAARRSFWELIRSLSAEGVTIVLTTHYLDEAAQLADRVGIIAEGRLRALGGVDDVGGASARTPIVRWREGDALRERRTDEPGAVVADLVRRLGGEPPDLQVVRPTLEDVYLDLVADSAASDPAPMEAAR
ncbi:MAG TPA: ABC transporter [Microbacterium sp.]|uniref:ABC transporter ATP-binding protein n=1 Tax=Microbacterium sp. UBA1612 TaxID=1946942 RepID=UPI000E93DC98|nr:ABC transporter ATP-binding protein [Microbacterium sp. UBA1612]HBR88401.1 ABC transporter [Microbacterium sp.]|tara:strand:- start:266 stop:1144 length:879 start_codon:yes stop_codon:yes gene_type:complete